MKLGLKEIKERMKELKSWKLKKGKLELNLEFKDFKSAMKFVNKVAELAENEFHHPDIFIHSWNKVNLTLYTHDAKGLTEKDFSLAEKIEKILGKHAL